MNYQKLFKKPSIFVRFTGLSIAEFRELAKELKPLWEISEVKRLSRPNRKRKIGGGRDYKLKGFEDKLFLILISYKLYLTCDVLSVFFSLDKSNVSKLISRIEPVLAKSKKLKLPKIEIKRDRDRPISSVAELLSLYPEIAEFIGDATEQEIPKPKDKRNRKKYYSGKKKRHTIKTQIAIEKNSEQIFEISSSFPGSVHDYTIFRETNLPKKIPIGSKLYLDKGYDGAKKDFPSNNIVIPKKANRWHKLSKKDRLENREIGRKRIKVEHAILKCKRFRVLSQIYRHPLKTYGRKFKIIAGLVNFKGQKIITQLRQSLLTENISQPIFATI